ncbi:MAG: AAA family ATPase, partial [Candidatus Sumerlaeota bacterium]|nr:AAA family ATPase [Candidatus Sumerlaeota bacterium]
MAGISCGAAQSITIILTFHLENGHIGNMKIKRAIIRNFKGIADLELDFSTGSSGKFARLKALIGDNGSGKTSVLQAMALTLSLATRRTYDTASFRWHGFLPERVASMGKTRIELSMVFDDEEIRLTQELFQTWRDSRPLDWRQTHMPTPPSALKDVTLVFASGRVTSPQGQAAV